jgi:hypothetical protein
VHNPKKSDESKQYNFSATLIEEINQNKYEKTNRHLNANRLLSHPPFLNRTAQEGSSDGD